MFFLLYFYYYVFCFPSINECSPSPPNRTSPEPSFPFPSLYLLPIFFFDSTQILAQIHETHTMLTNLQQSTRAKLHTAHTLSHTLAATQSKLTSTENELENLKVEVDAKMAKHALDVKQINVCEKNNKTRKKIERREEEE